jgi:delta24(24(1))-sterol reductase
MAAQAVGRRPARGTSVAIGSDEDRGEAVERRIDSESVREFGGATGVVAIMLLSHLLLYYLWISWRYYGGALAHPQGLSDIASFLGRMWDHIATGAAPSWTALSIYAGFLVFQALLAAFLPGLRIKGRKIPSQGNIQLEYRCNGISAWYVTLATVAALHFSDLFPLTRVADEFGSLMTIAILSGNALALATYFGAGLTGNTHRMSGSVPYDFFMGAWLNPRIGSLDLKMWAEIRIAWILLFLLTASAAAQQYATYATVSTPMIFMLVAHALYANACMKGEECIPTTWDIFYEKWGWMLIFWNLAGVPFVYSFNSMYLAQRPPFEHSIPYTVFCFALLLSAYYVWDTAQSQRNRFRMKVAGTYVRRRTFPQLPWATLDNPDYLKTSQGSMLLLGGWWRHARKIHYTADLLMALSWGLICGFDHFLPYFYFCFFLVMILHRTRRDISRCERKYGADWDRYREKVPYLFIPRVY